MKKFFLTWITKILLNCSYEVVKKRNKEWPSNEIVEVTEEAVSRLKEINQSAIILLYFHDLSISDVAKVMNIPENTVKTYLSRGKAQLNGEKPLQEVYEKEGVLEAIKAERNLPVRMRLNISGFQENLYGR